MKGDLPEGRANAHRMRTGMALTLGALLAVLVVVLLVLGALFG